MKRCPTCNQTFSEGWLSFCTQDGTTLIDDSVSKSEPPPTIMSSAPPPLVSYPNQAARVTDPNSPPKWSAPAGGMVPGQFAPPQPIQAGWQPPPPPAVVSPQQGLAVASMVCGIFTITIGWCCYLGVLSGPAAIGMGIYQLIQIKNNPEKAGGKPFAIVGIVLASVYFLGLAFIILLYGVAIFTQGLK